MTAKNYLRSATPISLRAEQSSYQGTVKDKNPFRYYQLQLNQRSSVHLSLSGLKANANLSLINSNGKTLHQSARGGTSKEAITRTVEPGTYYVRVSRQAGATRYKLSIDVDSVGQAPALTQQTPSSTGNSLADQVVALVNVQRNSVGLKPLRLNPLLSTAAQAHSQDMALNDFFGHTGSSGSTADQRILAAGYNYMMVGENVAAGFSTPESVVDAWMNSPSHRENILHPLLTEVGIGFYSLENDPGNANFRHYWTQDFGKPMA